MVAVVNHIHSSHPDIEQQYHLNKHLVYPVNVRRLLTVMEMDPVSPQLLDPATKLDIQCCLLAR